MYDALTSPPMPAWNGLSEADRREIAEEWRSNFCPCCGVNGTASYFYEHIRKRLKSREKRILEATMAG